MRIVLDTNILVAALVSHGACSELLEHCIRHHEVVTSAPLLEELRSVLTVKFGFSTRDGDQVASLLRTRFRVVAPADLEQTICRDPDDDRVLAAALEGRCDCIVTGDNDLLVLRKFKDIDVVSPANFWKYEDKL